MTIAFVVFAGARPMAETLARQFAPDAILAGSYAEIEDRLADIEAIVTSTSSYDFATVEMLRRKAPRLRWVQALSSGVDHHLAAGLPDGVTLTSASGAHAPAVADHALALTLSLLRGLPHFRAKAERRDWSKGADLPPLRTLHRARCLVLGYGPIGAAVTRRLLGFEAKVTVATRSPVALPEGVEPVRLDQLDAALPRAEIVVLCLPDAPGTTGILSRARLLALPRGALVVNIGRGGLIDEAALVDALRENHLGGAGLDVMAVEPLPADHPLWTLESVEITPHVAGRSAQGYDRLAEIVGENLRRFAQGRDLINVAAIGPVEGEAH
jgi:phosphoglycerate dehydrogenase-like enzyme